MSSTRKKPNIAFDKQPSNLPYTENNLHTDDIRFSDNMKKHSNSTKDAEADFFSLMDKYFQAVEGELDENDERALKEERLLTILRSEVHRVNKRIEDALDI